MSWTRFEEIKWQLQQQTDILQSIDHTLKTPSETQANEWRRMAEELRRRGVLDKSEELFLKAVNLNPLDYRIYVGLAQTYLQMNQFDKAKRWLEESLPHAPHCGKRQMRGEVSIADLVVDWNGAEELVVVGYEDEKEDEKRVQEYFDETLKKQVVTDYRSYSYRLIGHIHACEENYDQAVAVLQLALELSPNYEDAHYDYAQYCAMAGKKKDCLDSLRKAIMLKPFYFYLAPSERNFAPLRKEVQELLDLLKTETSNKAKEFVFKSEEMLRQSEAAISEAREAYWKSDLESWRTQLEKLEKAKRFYKEAKEGFNRIKGLHESGDYSKLVKIEPEIGVVRRNANEAKRIANEVQQICKKYPKPSALIGFLRGIALSVRDFASFVLVSSVPLVLILLGFLALYIAIGFLTGDPLWWWQALLREMGK
ncbi:tetratricopeptide repeat protein [Dehalococcoidia bacterium]|nr:tetratricopeptide repeat protein [Dehalococcoidia bacterium]